MHEHDRYIALISAVLDGEAAPAEAAELMDHLSACPACQAVYDQMLAMREAFLGWEEPELPGDLTAAVMDRVRQEPRTAARRRTIPIGLRRFAAAAACLALILLGARLLPPQSASPAEQGLMLTSNDAPAEAYDVEPAPGSTPAPRSLEPETDPAQTDEQLPDGVLTYFNSVPARKSSEAESAASGVIASDPASASAAPVTVTTLSSSDPELLQWMSTNVTASGYQTEDTEDAEAATVWLVTAEEYQALLVHLADAQAEVSVEYAGGEETGEEVYCVVYLRADE